MTPWNKEVKVAIGIGAKSWAAVMNTYPRNLQERLKEHLKALSPIHGHHSTTGHLTPLDNFSTVGREGLGFARTIKKPIFINVNNPIHNRNISKYNLPHIWGGVLNNTPELQATNQPEHHPQVDSILLTPPRSSGGCDGRCQTFTSDL